MSNQSIIQCATYFGRLNAQSVYRKLKFMGGEVSRLCQQYGPNFLSLVNT